jgi:hypothetical protein
MSKKIKTIKLTRRISSTPPAESAVAAGKHCRLARLLGYLSIPPVAKIPRFIYTPRSFNRSSVADNLLHGR